MLWTHAVVLILVLSPPPCCPADLDRFPPCIHEGPCDDEACYITGCPAIASRQDWLRAQRAMHPREWEEWDAQIAEQEQLEETWKILWYARVHRKQKCYSPDLCVYQLQRLRDLLGERDYALGRMPPPVPIHRYRSIDP